MKTLILSRTLVTFSLFLFIYFAVNAQENQKEVHIKIIDNGKVTKDTVYNSTGESGDIEDIIKMEEHHHGKGKKHMVEKRVIVMSDSTDSDSDAEMMRGIHKEVKVTVQSGDSKGEGQEVEEVWIDGHDKPCHTIIIHEGDCPAGKMKMNDKALENNPCPAHVSEKSVNVEKQVIKTGDGEKIIIVETSDDSPHKDKGNKKK